MEYYVVCRDADLPYLPFLKKYGCMDGDIEYLYNKIQENPKFCRDQKNIGYQQFLDSINKTTCLYIKENDSVLGVCTIAIISSRQSFDRVARILLKGICVPSSSQKGTGTLLIRKLQELAINLNMEISLSAMPDIVPFYEKNGFIKRSHTSLMDDEIHMVFPGVRGGKIRNRKKSKRKKSKSFRIHKKTSRR
jgi:predicted GNAT family N-acyltransferase